MKKNVIFQLLFLVVSFQCLSQPYSGTIFVDADIILSTDSSALQEVNYIGQDVKTIFDRRVDDWITVNAFLFEVVWNDGLNSVAVINPEFATVELAENEANIYGWNIGKLPHCLRVDVDEIWINKGVELFGGGNNSILIHTGQTILYENDGILEETLVHEASHTSLDAMHAASAGWLNAQNLDEEFISDYAKDNPDREDIAESFLMWMAVRYRSDRISTVDYELITEAIPNRLLYFDEIVCDLFPFLNDKTTAYDHSSVDTNEIMTYPNPTSDFITLELEDERVYQLTLYNALSEVVLVNDFQKSQEIDLSALSKGIYYFVLNKDGQRFVKKVIKF